VEEAPGDGSDVVEELDRRIGTRRGEHTSTDEQPKMGVDLFGETVGDAVVVHPATATDAETVAAAYPVKGCCAPR